LVVSLSYAFRVCKFTGDMNRRTDMYLRKLMTIAVMSILFTLPVMANESKKVCFMYASPIGDSGWTYAHDQGRRLVEEKLGKKVTIDFLEGVPEGPDAESAIRKLVKKTKCNMIVATSLSYRDSVLNEAKENTKVKFEHASGHRQADNVSTFDVRDYEAKYLAGHIAGKMTKTNVVGVVASFPIPWVKQGINAAYLAAKKVNPDVIFIVKWANTWYDPVKEAGAAKALIQGGADVLIPFTESRAVLDVARANKVYAFGLNRDSNEWGEWNLGSINYQWGAYYVDRIQAMLDGKWSSEHTWGGFQQGMLSLDNLSNEIPLAVRQEVKKMQAQMENGNLDPFHNQSGQPWKNQDGEVWLKSGEKASDDQLHDMDFLMEGVHELELELE
jgi:basic membrane protein A and related proteins